MGLPPNMGGRINNLTCPLPGEGNKYLYAQLSLQESKGLTQVSILDQSK